MIVTHVYKPFVTVSARGNVVLRFGRDAAEAAKGRAYLFVVQDPSEETWALFVRDCAKAFLEVTFKEW